MPKQAGLIILSAIALSWPAMQWLMPPDEVRGAQELRTNGPMLMRTATLPSATSDIVGLGLSRLDLTNALELSNPLWTIPLTALEATRDRPIFAQSRRPSPHLPRDSGPVKTSRQLGQPSFGLVGVIASDEKGIAIVRDQATKVIVRLKTGETHSGWTLQAVQGREARLQRGRETAVLTLPNPAVLTLPNPPAKSRARRTK